MILRRTIQISHARRAGEPSLLKYGAMLSGDIMGDLGESKGVVLWLLDRPLNRKAHDATPRTGKLRIRTKDSE
jgi:hypothetical protein